MNLLAGVGQFFEEQGCFVLHYLDEYIPHIKIKRHKIKGFVEAQVIGNHLWLRYMPYTFSTMENFLRFHRKCGKTQPVGIPKGVMLDTREGSRSYPLQEPDSLHRAMRYVRKHLFPVQRKLRGGL